MDAIKAFVGQKKAAIDLFGLQPNTSGLGSNPGLYPWISQPMAFEVAKWWGDAIDNTPKKDVVGGFLEDAKASIAYAGTLVGLAYVFHVTRVDSDPELKFLTASHCVAFWEKIGKAATDLSTHNFAPELPSFWEGENLKQFAQDVAYNTGVLAGKTAKEIGDVVGRAAGGAVSGLASELLVPVAIVGGGYVLLRMNGVIA